MKNAVHFCLHPLKWEALWLLQFAIAAMFFSFLLFVYACSYLKIKLFVFSRASMEFSIWHIEWTAMKFWSTMVVFRGWIPLASVIFPSIVPSTRQIVNFSNSPELLLNFSCKWWHSHQPDLHFNTSVLKYLKVVERQQQWSIVVKSKWRRGAALAGTTQRIRDLKQIFLIFSRQFCPNA